MSFFSLTNQHTNCRNNSIKRSFSFAVRRATRLIVQMPKNLGAKHPHTFGPSKGGSAPGSAPGGAVGFVGSLQYGNFSLGPHCLWQPAVAGVGPPSSEIICLGPQHYRSRQSICQVCQTRLCHCDAFDHGMYLSVCGPVQTNKTVGMPLISRTSSHKLLHRVSQIGKVCV